ncbi:hypothetical protein B0T26DRAFT_813100 [Lasiosphaeria miniovina]|uniref:J domain-containing protein n=1 Tax=Lasiosphaeria miniovina TaxID=1954250 RepID=A0AA40ABG3_9PEZI|nr:uncharacterized protein B0T26DRAFT_813100 [Lasiosphaeria miniovina]KAK0712808.1 hypothetical protein B0T26DRAFT_813100 [Lasiosphaeria miniovina]
MVLKKSTAALCSHAGVFSSFRPLPLTASPVSSHNHLRHARRYASVQDESHRPDVKDADTPHWPASPSPTPYEIFAQASKSPYDKGRFYQLVMLYHPDRHCHSSHDGIPSVTKLDRYRLVIAANDILSNSDKRRLYDLYGTGWKQPKTQNDQSESDVRSTWRDVDKAWRQRPGNASANATWEDWERWYQERDGKKQEPRFMSNGGFASVIALFVLVGTWGQATRAEMNSATLLETRDQRHSSIHHDFQHHQSQISGLGKEDRVDAFLRQRNAWEYASPGHLQQGNVRSLRR